ncbi:MAG TPA: DMT family transporter [Candidatus Acidoferrales bacterium]|nr:DMT family transporter [Candidatus Acidoferrales bacterium]
MAAALLFSTGGAAIKAANLPGWQIACFRSGIAAVTLLAVIPAARRGWNRRTIPVAAAYAATLILFVLANRLTTSANAIFLQATAPLYVLLLSPLLLREPIRRADLFYIAGVAAGMSCFFTSRQSAMATAPDPALGNVLALASGVAYAFMLLGLRWLGRRGDADSGIATVAAGNLLAFAAALGPALPLAPFTPGDTAVLLYLGIAQIGLAYWCLTAGITRWCLTAGITRVPAFEAVTTLQLEVAMNPVWTWLVHGERPGARSLAGGAIIVCATVLNTWRSGTMLKKSEG